MGNENFRQNMPVSVASASHVCIIPLVSVFWLKGKGSVMSESTTRDEQWAEFWAMIRKEAKK